MSATIKNRLLLFSFLLIFISGRAQVNESLLPKSFTISGKFFPTVKETVLPPLNITEAEKLDKIDSKTGDLPKFSRSIYTNLNLDNSGSWSTLPDGGRVWRLHIEAQGALALIPFYNHFFIPEGGMLHIYSPDKEEILGAFTAANYSATGYYCTGLIHGDECVIEYYEPREAIGKGKLSINEVGYAYRWITSRHKSTNTFGTSAGCEVNVNCSEGAGWQDQKRSVVRILVQSSQGQGFCSGALINNARQDCTPYLLSAQHCSEGVTNANQYSQWVFYFNYEAPSCSNPATEGSLGNQVVIGCSKKADSNDNGGDSGSDFLLLELSSQPNVAFNVFYSGWNTSSAAPSSGVCIHHPDADIKKISTYTTTPSSSSWGGSVPGTHWRVRWAATANGHGVTEPGSSGSPLFNDQGQIVGKLTGGDSYCQTPTSPDMFGKVAYDWTSNGSTATRQLKPWLDPDNTGVTSLGGANYPCGTLLQNDAGIVTVTNPSGNICDISFVPTVVLKNFGGNNLTSVTIQYAIDGTAYQYGWSGNLSALSSTTVSLPSITLSTGNHTFQAGTNHPNGANDSDNSNDSASTSFTISPPSGLLNLHLETDSYGSETTWEITDSNAVIIFSGGPYGDSFNGLTYNIPICLAPGCYTLTLFDSYGDGMSGNVNGAMTLTGQSGSIVYATLTDPDFGARKDFPFCIQGTTGISELNTVNILVEPNPSTGIFNLQSENEEQKTIKVYNDLGRLVFSQVSFSPSIPIDLSQRGKGIYFVQVETAKGKATRKLVLR